MNYLKSVYFSTPGLNSFRNQKIGIPIKSKKNKKSVKKLSSVCVKGLQIIKNLESGANTYFLALSRGVQREVLIHYTAITRAWHIPIVWDLSKNTAQWC